MKKHNRKIALVLCVVLALSLGLLTGCGGKEREGSPLPENMDEQTVIEAGREIVAELNAGEYQAILDKLRDDIAAGGARPLTAEDIKKSTMDTITKAGVYVMETNVMATGQDSKDFDEDFAEAVIFAKHEKKDVRYRISFDQDMNLIGLQVRQY